MKINKLRALIISTLLLISLISRAQYECNLNPDTVFKDSHTYWWSHDETVLYGYQGEIFLITLKDLYTGKVPYVYKIDHHGYLSDFKMLPDNKNYFLFGYEDETDYYSGTQGNYIAFTFNGQFWFYQNYKDWSTTFHHTDDSYDCFARFPTDANLPYRTYYDKISGKPVVIKKGAFQHDSTLYFLGIYNKSGDPNYGKWCFQKYNYDKANDKFIFEKNTLVADMPGDRLGGMLLHTDSTGNVKMVVNTYRDSGNDCWIGWLIPTTPPGGETTFVYEAGIPMVATLINSRASTLLKGTAKGGRTIDNVDIPTASDRMLLFGYGNSNTSVINYKEYEFYKDQIYDIGEGSIIIPSSIKPATWDSYNLVGAIELVPKKFNNVVGNEANGYIQRNWIYYPDDNGRVCGLGFTSDSWKPIPDSTVISDDLFLDAISDSTYGPEVRSLWSLAGITDGGPPSSVNWETWDQHHTSTIRPTELTMSIEGEYSSSVTTTTEDQFTEGIDLNIHKKYWAMDLGMDFGQAFKNTVSSSHSWTNTLTIPFELNEESQEHGYYIYVVPTITRETYKRYPWWDPGFLYPIPQSKQYRFSTKSTSVIYRSREIDQFPFYIDEPNAASLNDWKLANRANIYEDVTHSGLQPICSPSWSSPNPGQTGTFLTAADTSSSFDTKKSYKVDASFTAKKPHVFELETSVGYEVNYETSTENEWKLSKEVEVSLKNMTEKSLGLNFNSYVVHAYWFKPEDYDWWFYDSTGTDRPWYVAYSVSNLTASVNLISPLAGAKPDSNGILFIWEATDIDPAEYALFISKSPYVSPSGTVYRLNTGLNTNYFVADLQFIEKEETYYWAVRAIHKSGDITWSESRPFAAATDPGRNNSENALNIIPYPNPGTGNNLHIMAESREKGTLYIRIIGLDGRVLYRTDYEYPEPGVQSLLLPELALKPGVYLLETTINNNKVTRKLVIGR